MRVLEELKETLIMSYNKIPPKVEWELEEIERDLKVLQILKEKKVDLNWINKNIIEEDICPTQTEVDEYYFQHNKESYILLEEMTLIVEWLKER